MVWHNLAMDMPLIVHHMAALDGWPHPPNTLEAIEACLRAEADVVEVDITALADGDYLLVHDPKLEPETNGAGEVGATASIAARELFVKDGGRVTTYRVPQLADVVSLYRRYPNSTRLQLDFKNALPFPTDEPLERLAGLIEPLGDRVIVSSGADWQLRRLRKIAPLLRLGFDMMWYLDWSAHPDRRDPAEPPFKLGAYGYLDDHVIAGQHIWPASTYLHSRCESLLGLVPGVEIFYVRHGFIARALDDGFNLADLLHAHGIKLDAWTLDVGKPDADANAPRLRDAGVDLITTNTPRAMRASLRG